MPIAIRSVVAGKSSGAVGETVTVTTPTDTEVGDVLLALHGKDYYVITNMAAPTGTAGTWTERASRDAGTNKAKLKAWTRTVTTAGAQSVTIAAPDDAARAIILLTLSGVDTTDPIPVSDGNSSTSNQATLSAPTVTPPVTDCLLVCAYMTGGGTFANSNITPNGTAPVVELTNIPGSTSIEQDTGYSTMTAGSLALSGTGATGAKTAACSPADAYAALSLVIRPGVAAPSGPEPGRSLLAA